MLSVMVILLSEMNSYKIRVAIAVLSPSKAPCLVFALKETNVLLILKLKNSVKLQRNFIQEQKLMSYKLKQIFFLPSLYDQVSPILSLYQQDQVFWHKYKEWKFTTNVL